MDNSFTVVGQILDVLHLPECEGAEFELGIWMEIRGIRKTRQDNRLATNRIIFLASSNINYPLILEKDTTTPPSLLPSSFTLHNTSINNSSLICFIVKKMPEYLVSCIAVSYSLF